jgi:hypothetical protein
MHALSSKKEFYVVELFEVELNQHQLASYIYIYVLMDPVVPAFSWQYRDA